MWERPGVKATLIIDDHFAQKGHNTAISGKGERTRVEIIAPREKGSNICPSGVMLSTL